MAILAEQAAPTWLPVVGLSIPVVIMLAVGIPALARRARWKAARRSQARARPAASTAIGSASSISDPSGYSSEAVLNALAVRPESHGPGPDGLPHDEGWAGTMLGLKSRMSTATSFLEPHVFWGSREGRQVFIRVGPDERIAGGSVMLSNRHVRSITVLRVGAPSFGLRSAAGDLRPSDGAPSEIVSLAGSLTPDPVIWSDVLVAGGPEGIVVARPALDGVENPWAYDLWLCELIARKLALEPLKPARIGPAWKVPYGLGASLEPSGR